LVTTDIGPFTIQLDPAQAPKAVNSFVFLARQHFFDCITFHRVIPSFVDQTGDPTGSGSGGPGYQFADELPKVATPQYPLGSVAMANSGANTNGSQFFIVTGSSGETLAPNYTLFGMVTSGQAVVQKINQVVRGTANYFGTTFSHCGDLFRTLDRWLRMRSRCMKFKRKRVTDNWRLRLKHLRRQGLLFLGEIRAPPAKERSDRPALGATAMASPGA